jgi:tetratricopeptide (TPR) repeat protein
MKGDNEGAEKLFRQAIEDDPNYAQGHLNLGLILAQQQKFTDAEPELDNAIKLVPEDVAALAAAGKVKARLGKSGEGVALLRKVVALRPQSAAAHLDLAIALADSYDLPGALAETGEAVRLAPESAAAHFNHGRVLFDLGRNAEAQSDFESACRLSPHMAEPPYYLAVVEKQAGHYQQAAALLRTVVKLQPRNVMALHLLGQSLEHESQTQAAIAAWRQAVAIDPDYSQALWSLARAMKPSDPDEAARLMARYGEVQKKRRIVDQAGTLANDALAASEAHDWPEAIRQLQQAIEVCGGCVMKADLHKNLGLIDCQMGDIDSGEKELRLAQASKSADPDIARALTLIAQARAQRQGVASHPEKAR